MVGKKYRDLNRDLLEYQKARVEALNTGRYRHVTEAFEGIAKKYSLQHRLVSAKEFNPSETRSSFVKKKSVEQLVGLMASLFIFGSILFVSTNITGNTISTLRQSSVNLIGGVLFIVGIVGALIYFKTK